MKISAGKHSGELLRKLLFILLSVVSGFGGGVFAAPSGGDGGNYSDSHIIETLTMADGLNHNFVDDIFRDSRGFLWIGYGGGGLARYDGYEFVNFTTNSPMYHLRGTFADEIAEDRFGRLWVSTEGGISVISIHTLRPAEVADDEKGSFAELLRHPSLTVSSDSLGRIWTTAGQQIYCFGFDEKGGIKEAATLGLHHFPRGIASVCDIDGNGSPWCNVSGNICRLVPDFTTGKIEATPVDGSLSLPTDVMVGNMVRNGNDVWIATEFGLWRFDTTDNRLQTYVNDPSDPHSLSQNYVNSVAVTPDKRIIAGTLQGISVYNPLNDNFDRIGRAEGLKNIFVNKVFSDHDRVWIGTEGGGLSSIIDKRIFTTLHANNLDAPGLSFNTPVNAILVDGDNNVWVGASEGGLHCLNGGNPENINHYSVQTGVLGHNSVSALATDGSGNLWAGTWGGGVDVLAVKPSVSRLREIRTTSNSSLGIGYVGALKWDHLNKLMWIGTARGLFIYNPLTDETTEAFVGSNETVIGTIGAAIDRNNHLWLGSSEGLIDIDLKRYGANPGKDAVRIIRGHLDYPGSVANERVTYLFIDSHDRLWIGTNGNGLFLRKADDGKETFEGLSMSSGLPSDIIMGITESRSGNIWVSTYKGLAKIRTLTDGHLSVESFDDSDGLECDFFYWNSAACSPTGDLLFGCGDGLLTVYGTNSDSVNQALFPVGLSHILVENNEADTELHNGRLTIGESCRSVEFVFSSLDFGSSSQGQYSYRLKGFFDDWTELPEGIHSVRFTNLSSGNYELQVVYRRNGQTFDYSKATVLPVTVVPHIYKRWWFIMLTVIILALGIVWIYRLRMSSIMRQQRLLQETVEERTAEILEQKRQVQQLTMDRISFFTNITHEFRTPITLILGPIARALKLSYNPQVIEQLHFVERNSRYLLSLVNQLMDFRKVESGKMEIMLSRGNLLQILEEIVGSFRPIADDRGIQLQLIARLPRPVMSFDGEALQKVLINLLGNALKFTPDNGRITLYATVLPAGCASERNSIYLSVSDNGAGINPEDIDHIFDRFYQGTSPLRYPVAGTAGSGIGLYLCRNLVEIHGGNISVKNNRDCGCVFRVILPLPEGETPEAVPGEDIPALNADQRSAFKAAETSSAAAERLTILVVEDNDDMRSFIRSILSGRYNVAEARNGEEALKVLANREIDFIISDLMMPVMDGMELSRRVKERFDISHIPFLMLTAKTSRESRLEGYRTGVDEYILKPFDEELLLARIENIIANRRRQQESFAQGKMQVEQLNIDEDSRDKKFMDQVMKVVRENYRNSYFEIGDFAELLGVSRSLLNKKLQNLTGQSAGQLLRTFRLNTARDLLLRNRTTRSMNISEIAYEVGFNDSKYFTRCFTKHFSVTPSSMLNDA